LPGSCIRRRPARAGLDSFQYSCRVNSLTLQRGLHPAAFFAGTNFRERFVRNTSVSTWAAICATTFGLAMADSLKNNRPERARCGWPLRRSEAPRWHNTRLQSGRRYERARRSSFTSELWRPSLAASAPAARPRPGKSFFWWFRHLRTSILRWFASACSLRRVMLGFAVPETFLQSTGKEARCARKSSNQL